MSTCDNILSRAIGQRALEIERENARLGMGRPSADDRAQANRELAPILEAFFEKFFAPAPISAPNSAKAFYCEKLHQCKWQGFRLHQGLGWGEIPGERDPWRVWHTKECGGRLVELFTRVELEEVRADAT